MTTPGTKSVGTQCDLLAAPPLTLMSHADTTTESSEPEDGDIDDSVSNFSRRSHNRVSTDSSTPINN